MPISRPSATLRIVLLWLILIYTLLCLYRLLKANHSIAVATAMDKNRAIMKQLETIGTLEVASRNENLFSEKQTSQPEIALNNKIFEKNEPDIATSKNAYITLLHGIDDSLRYRGFLYHCIVMKESLHRLGSTADFLVMIGFTEKRFASNPMILKDLELLKSYGVKLFFLPRLLPINLETEDSTTKKVNFLEMALLKVSPWSMTEYERIQYMDADVLPYKNMDCLFSLDRNSFNTGNASPLNSGWFLSIPNKNDYQALVLLARTRMSKKWDEVNGWGKVLPPDIFYRGGTRVVKKWEFNGASLDQGLLTHYFVLGQGRIQVLDAKDTRKYNENYQYTTESVKSTVQVCNGIEPMDMFYHFTGQNKPWLRDLSQPQDKSVRSWVEIFDSLKLPANSSNFGGKENRPPLGFFHPNK